MIWERALNATDFSEPITPPGPGMAFPYMDRLPPSIGYKIMRLLASDYGTPRLEIAGALALDIAEHIRRAEGAP